MFQKVNRSLRSPKIKNKKIIEQVLRDLMKNGFQESAYGSLIITSYILSVKTHSTCCVCMCSTFSSNSAKRESALESPVCSSALPKRIFKEKNSSGAVETHQLRIYFQFRQVLFYFLVYRHLEMIFRTGGWK